MSECAGHYVLPGRNGAIKKHNSVSSENILFLSVVLEMYLKCIEYSTIMGMKKDYDHKNRKTEKDWDLYIDQGEDLNWDTDTDEDPDIDPDQSEASRYNEEKLLDSDHQVNEHDSLHKHGNFGESNFDSKYPAHEGERIQSKGRDSDNRVVN
jgi:hypothetical protein